MGVNKKEIERQKIERLKEENINFQGCLMEISNYDNSDNIIVRFKDDYNGEVHTTYSNFKKGVVKNPYYPSVRGVGIIGSKYSTRVNGSQIKEYKAWYNMMMRCFDKKTKERNPTYQNVTCCDDWLLFENFYEWLHEQENFDKWLDGYGWDIDKDILVKGNKVYSPETCCLVPQNINKLFLKRELTRGILPIGIRKYGEKFQVQCQNILTNKCEYLGTYNSIEESFKIYKQYKENLIKLIAKIEYDNGKITKKCYEVMMNYEVEIND